MTYDPKCFELAEYFIDDLALDWSALDAPKARRDLAAHIQESIEDWIRDFTDPDNLTTK